MPNCTSVIVRAVVTAAALACGPVSARVQAQVSALDSLVAVALARHPALDAARARVAAAQARIRPAGTLPDPMIAVGIMNLPLDLSGYDDMSMNVISAGQTLPYPGRLRLQREIAVADVAVEEAMLAARAADITRDVKGTYYELALSDRVLGLLAKAQSVAIGLTQSAESRYAAGTSPQLEMLRFQVEAAGIAEEAAMVAEQKRAAYAHLQNLVAAVKPDTSLRAVIPAHVRAAAIHANPARIRFASAHLGARVLDSPLPSLLDLQQRAAAGNPELRAASARINTQTIRVRIAEQAHLPDINVELQYGQRPRRGDMISLMVSLPLPARRAASQQPESIAVRAELASLEAERAALLLDVNSDIAELYSELEALRAQLALYVRSILPQGRAAFESAAAGYAAGKTEFAAVIEQRATVFEYELAYERAVTDFAKRLTELERLVGAELIS